MAKLSDWIKKQTNSVLKRADTFAPLISAIPVVGSGLAQLTIDKAVKRGFFDAPSPSGVASQASPQNVAATETPDFNALKETAIEAAAQTANVFLQKLGTNYRDGNESIHKASQSIGDFIGINPEGVKVTVKEPDVVTVTGNPTPRTTMESAAGPDKNMLAMLGVGALILVLLVAKK